MSDENIVFQERPPWKAYTGMFALAFFVAAVFYYSIFTYLQQGVYVTPGLAKFVIYLYILPIILALLMICTALISRFSYLYTLTDKKIISRVGLIRRDERTAPISKITDTRVSQGLWQRLLGYGNVQISTAGSSGYEVNFININNPYYVKIEIDDLIEKGIGSEEKK